MHYLVSPGCERLHLNMDTQKSALISLIGPPNAGKSTLLNTILGEKVSIVSSKVQTTRTRVRGILTKEETQLVFTDTPGLFQPKKKLERAIVQAAIDGMGDADAFCIMLDSSFRTLSDWENVQKVFTGKNIPSNLSGAE